MRMSCDRSSNFSIQANFFTASSSFSSKVIKTLWPRFRWWVWSQCQTEVIYRGSGSQMSQHLSCWSPLSCGAYRAASGLGDETLGSSSCGTTWTFSSEQPSSAGCKPRGPGSGSTWPYVPPSEGWKTQARSWLWCSARWHGSGGVK